MDKYHPGYFGKVGMRNFHLRKPFCPTVNCDRLWSLVSERTREQYAAGGDRAPVIDCVQAVRARLHKRVCIVVLHRAITKCSARVDCHVNR